MRKREIIRGDDWEPETPEVIYEAFYNTAGDLLREIQNRRVVWHIREGGLPFSVVKEEDDFIRYDKNARVNVSRVEGIFSQTKWNDDGSRRVVSKYPWGEVFLRFFDKDGNFAQMPASEKFPERSSL